MAMKAVAGMANPLLEACLVRTGTRLAFRHHGAMVDPIRRQLLFDFERLDAWQEPTGRRLVPSRCAMRSAGRFASAACRTAFWPRCRPRRRAKSSAPFGSTRRLWRSIRVCGGLHQPGNDLLPPAPIWARRRALPPGHGGRSELCAGVLRSGQRAGRAGAAG